MLPVEIVPIDGSTLVLRARGSELLILPQHVGHLKSCKTPKEFAGYFLSEALLNRPARKLFEAWLRKDRSLWQRIYQTVQKEMEAASTDEAPAKKEVKNKPTPMEKPKKEAATAAAPESKVEKPAKAAAPATKKKAEKEKPAKAEKKPAAKKAAAAPKKAAAKKSGDTKKKAKPKKKG